MCKKNISVVEHEKYYYYDEQLLFSVLENNNFDILKINDGYGKNDFKHKHLYHCKKKS